ncbi:MAG: FIST signal transduction protein [Actinomycetota bacterium]
MAVGHSDDVDPDDAVAAAIDECRAALGDLTPQAGILFSAFESFHPDVVAAVRKAFPGVGLAGTTSAAEISSSGYREDSIMLALFASDSVDFTVGLGSGLGRDVEKGCRAAVEQATSATDREPRICVVLADSIAADPRAVLEAMRAALPPGVVLVGGASARSDFSQLTPTYQFCNEAVASDGIAVLLLSGPVTFSTAVGTGWKTIGPRGRVTGASPHAIEEIDGRPAADFVRNYIDVIGPAAFGNPLAVFEEGSEEFYLRAIPQSDLESGSLTVPGSVPEGAEVQLTTAATDEIISGTEAALREAAEGFPAGSTPEAALIFSCAIRKFLLGSKTPVESELARSVLGSEIPIAGLYCFGEFGPIEGTGGSRFLNETFVTLLLGS